MVLVGSRPAWGVLIATSACFWAEAAPCEGLTFPICKIW